MQIVQIPYHRLALILRVLMTKYRIAVKFIPQNTFVFNTCDIVVLQIIEMKSSLIKRTVNSYYIKITIQLILRFEGRTSI